MIGAFALLIGCNETSSTGGSGGTCEPQTGCPEDGDLCTHDECIDGACIYVPVDCDDHNDCTSNAGQPDEGCTTASVADGTVCAGGTRQDGRCALSGTELPCSEQAIRNAIAVGGGPYTFDCDGPTTVVPEAEIVIDNDVILDGEGALTVDAQQTHRVYSVATDTTAELRGFTISRGNAIRGGDILNEGMLTLAHSTVSENWTRFLGGPAIWADRGMLTLTNCLIDDCYRSVGTITSNGHNIETYRDSCGLDQPTDQVNVSADDLKLEELADNGGPTETAALLPGSVAIDAIPTEDCVDSEGAPLTTDQRGEPRPGGTMCDVGAFEVQP